MYHDVVQTQRREWEEIRGRRYVERTSAPAPMASDLARVVIGPRLEEIVREGLIKGYAIGGATAPGFHGEPLAARDVDVREQGARPSRP